MGEELGWRGYLQPRLDVAGHRVLQPEAVLRCITEASRRPINIQVEPRLVSEVHLSRFAYSSLALFPCSAPGASPVASRGDPHQRPAASEQNRAWGLRRPRNVPQKAHDGPQKPCLVPMGADGSVVRSGPSSERADYKVPALWSFSELRDVLEMARARRPRLGGTHRRQHRAWCQG